MAHLTAFRSPSLSVLVGELLEVRLSRPVARPGLSSVSWPTFVRVFQFKRAHKPDFCFHTERERFILLGLAGFFSEQRKIYWIYVSTA